MGYYVVAVIPDGAEKGDDRVEQGILFCRVVSHVGRCIGWGTSCQVVGFFW